MNMGRQAINATEKIKNRFSFLDGLKNNEQLAKLLTDGKLYSLLTKEKLNEIKNPKVREVIDRMYNYILPLCIAVAADNNIDILRDTQGLQFPILNNMGTTSNGRITIDYNELPFISASFTFARDKSRSWDYNWDSICNEKQDNGIIEGLEDIISELIHRRNLKRREVRANKGNEPEK